MIISAITTDQNLESIEIVRSLWQYALFTIIASKKDKPLRCPIEDW